MLDNTARPEGPTPYVDPRYDPDLQLQSRSLILNHDYTWRHQQPTSRLNSKIRFDLGPNPTPTNFWSSFIGVEFLVQG